MSQETRHQVVINDGSTVRLAMPRGQFWTLLLAGIAAAASLIAGMFVDGRMTRESLNQLRADFKEYRIAASRRIERLEALHQFPWQGPDG